MGENAREDDDASVDAAVTTRALHVRYFKMLMERMPQPYASLDTNRMMVLYFCVSALDLMGEKLSEEKRRRVIEWIYRQQIRPQDADAEGKPAGGFGFTGGGHAGGASKDYRLSHISMTYTALATLLILGDDLSRVDRDAVTSSLRALQRDDTGVYEAVAFGTESDTRFVFCACAISFMLQDWRGVNTAKAEAFLRSSIGFDGGFGLLPGNESHGGATYTALASWVLLGLDVTEAQYEEILRFCIFRQIGGFNGRINKKPDTCYTFWVGGSLQMLGCQDLIDRISTKRFLLKCQKTTIGGFSKVPGIHPDVLHSYYSVCGMCLIGEPGYGSLGAVLGISERAMASIACSRSSPPKTAAGHPLRHLGRARVGN